MTDDVWGLIEQKAQQYGEDPNTAKAIANIESGGRNVPNEGGGSAAGVFQFMPQTAAQYGVTNPYDVDQNVDAGVRLLRDNRAALKSSLGRDPTPGELYLAHQQGAGGATKLLTNPDLAAASVVGAKAVLANGGSLDMTAGQFANKWTTKVDGGSGYVPRPVPYTDLMAPPPVDPFKGTDDERMKYREGLMGELDAFRDAYSANTIVGNAWRNASMPDALKPDPNFAPTAEQIKGYATNAQGQTLPPEYMGRFHDALSAGQAKWIADRAWEDVGKQQKLASLGWAHNLGLNTAATLLDPATWAVGAATAGAVNPATSVLAQYGRLGMIGARAIEGGASNVAITAALQAQGAPTSDADYLSALAMGMALGAPFGMLGKAEPRAPRPASEAPKVSTLADGVGQAATSLSEHVGQTVTPAGEAATEVVQRPRSFNVGREALPHEVEVANDLTPSTTPTPEMVDSHARGAHPDLFARADDLDNQLQQARAQVQEALQPTTPEPLAGSRIAALQQELDQFTGKRRSSPRAKAVKAELTQLQAKPFSEVPPTIRDRIETAYLASTGGKYGEMVGLDKIRAALPGLDRATVDAALKKILGSERRARDPTAQR
jgi:hypothetical protein